MGGFSLIHWLILGVVILLLFGGNRFSSMMGDVAKGLKSFKQGMAEDDKPTDPRALPPHPHQPTPFQNPQDPYGQQPQAPLFPQQQQGQHQYAPPAQPQTIDLTPEPPKPADPNMAPPRGIPPGDDQAR